MKRRIKGGRGAGGGGGSKFPGQVSGFGDLSSSLNKRSCCLWLRLWIRDLGTLRHCVTTLALSCVVELSLAGLCLCCVVIGGSQLYCDV